MQRILTRPLFFLSSFAACAIMSLASGCASGGFKLTRQYAGWVNSQTLILRIVIYLLTGIVFAVTLLIDFVVFNTMDFWNGRVAAGDYKFQEGEKTFLVKHEILPESQLKKSTIKVLDADQKQLQEVVLAETPAGEIEMFVDGKLRTRVQGISSLPMASIYDENGKLTEQKTLWFVLPDSKTEAVVRSF